MPYFLGHVPQFNWIYGNLDYSFHKHHRHIQAHDDWYPDRKGKTLGVKNGGFCDQSMRNSKYMTLQQSQIPRGCLKEIRKYNLCSEQKGKDSCMDEKINIMEVCPDHVLDGLKEKKKWYLRAESIDNQTYKRAMTVGDYNKGRSVSDLELKTWEYGSPTNMRTDTMYQDDRYNPMQYPHAHRYDSLNFPEQEYKDIFGGNWGEAELKDKEHHALGLFSGKSKAMQKHIEEKRRHSLSGAVQEVKEHNDGQ